MDWAIFGISWKHFFTKVPQMFGDFLGSRFLSRTCETTFGATFEKIWATFYFDIWSHCSRPIAFSLLFVPLFWGKFNIRGCVTLKQGPILASVCLFSSFTNHNFNINWKKQWWRALDSNLGPQDGRCIAMAPAQDVLMLSHAFMRLLFGSISKVCNRLYLLPHLWVSSYFQTLARLYFIFNFICLSFS